MRKILLFGATLALVAGASPASAQGSWGGSLGGGLSLPMGNFHDFAKIGMHGAAALSYQPASSKWEWLLDASYHHHNAKAFDNAHDNLFAAFARANYQTSSSIYLIAGVGMMRDEFTSTVSGITTKGSQSAVAITAGLGARFAKRLFLEGRIMNGFTDNGATTIVPITIGVRF